MERVRKIKDLVQEAVDKGASTVEEVHQSIAALPLEILESIDGLEKPAQNVKEAQKKTIGGIYEIIRTVNEKVADLAEDIINRVDSDDEDDD